MITNKSLPFDYQVRRSVRAKKTRIVITADKIEVVIPYDCSDRGAHAFVNENQNWISTTLNKLRANRQWILPVPKRYVDGTMIPYLGERWPLTIVSTPLKRVKIEFINQFIAYVPASLASDNIEAAIRDALIKWMRNSVRAHIEAIITKHQQSYQLKPKSIRIKSQKTRWGSCGIHDDININWVLILAPPSILEYVVVHEICHIRHRNHSTAFWALVADHMPNYKQHSFWLRTNGGALMKGL